MRSGPLKQVCRLDVLFRLYDSDLIDGVLKHRRLNMTERGNFARGFVGCFLNDVPDVTLSPMPFNLMRRGSFVQPLPPIMVGLATKVALHSFDDVSRVSVHAHATRFLERFEPQGRRGNFSLLVG